MQIILDKTISIISIQENGLLIKSTCLYPFYSPDNTKVGFWVQDYDYINGIFLDTYQLYVKNLITNELSLINTGNGSCPLVNNEFANRFIYNALFSPDSSKILFLTTSTNLILADGLYSNPVSNLYRWYVKDLITNDYTRVSSNETTYGNNSDYYEALWMDDDRIVFTSFTNNLVVGVLQNNHKEVYLKTLSNSSLALVSRKDNSDISPFFSLDSYNISVTIDKVAFYSVQFGFCVKDIITSDLTRVQNYSGISSYGIVSPNVFTWSNDGSKFLFKISSGTSITNDENGVTDDFVYDLNTSTIIPLNENSGGTVFGSGFSTNSLFSPDNQSVAFLSNSFDIDPTSTNSVVNIYIKSLQTLSLRRVSVPVSGNNLATDILGFNWLDDNRIVFTTSSNDLITGDTNTKIDWFVRDIIQNTTTRINFNDSVMIFSENNETNYNIRRETFDIAGERILFSGQLIDTDVNFITPGLNNFNILSKVFVDALIDFPTTGIYPTANDGINAVAKNNYNFDAATFNDTITGTPTFSVIGSVAVERVNSTQYANVIDDKRWAHIKYPNLPSNAPTTKLGFGVFQYTNTLLDDIIDVKKNSVTTAANPVIGTLTTISVVPQNDIILITAGEDQQRVCSPMIYLEATINGNLTGHTFLWELIQGTPVVLTQNSQTQAYYTVDVSPTDRIFRYWIDKGKFNEQYQDTTVYSTPTSTYRNSFKINADINFPDYGELTVGNYSPFTNFDFNIPFNSEGSFSSIININWDLPKIYGLNDETANLYKSLFFSSSLELHDGNNWITVNEALKNESRTFNNISAGSLIRFGSTYNVSYGENKQTIYHSVPEYITPQIIANTVLSPVLPSSPASIVGSVEYTLDSIVYVVNNNDYDDTLSYISISPTVNQPDATITPVIYDVTAQLSEDTIYSNYTASATNSFTLTLFNGEIIGG